MQLIPALSAEGAAAERVFLFCLRAIFLCYFGRKTQTLPAQLKVANWSRRCYNHKSRPDSADQLVWKSTKFIFRHQKILFWHSAWDRIKISWFGSQINVTFLSDPSTFGTSEICSFETSGFQVKKDRSPLPPFFPQWVQLVSFSSAGETTGPRSTCNSPLSSLPGDSSCVATPVRRINWSSVHENYHKCFCCLIIFIVKRFHHRFHFAHLHKHCWENTTVVWQVILLTGKRNKNILCFSQYFRVFEPELQSESQHHGTCKKVCKNIYLLCFVDQSTWFRLRMTKSELNTMRVNNRYDEDRNDLKLSADKHTG